ncbi:tRNA 2-thiouridine(34) synthase MnmA [Myxococcota bacterium]|nr:tRNA 2-thiouridine(34) synthase MnmA [Myxococcota bacterium]
MTNKARVAVGMSGGVDSTITAMMLKEQGYEVSGAMMAIWDKDHSFDMKQANACYGPNEVQKVQKARELAEKLGIPFAVIDLSVAFRSRVLDYCREEYLGGRTPNPCVRCNHTMKFGELWEGIVASGFPFDYFATGHYVRKVLLDNGRWALRKGADPKKDQSYFLYALTQDQLSRTLFPLGEMEKTQVKARASELGLGFEKVKESQNFITGGYEILFEGRCSVGTIVDESGMVLGRHEGVWNYTVGQRKGLGISSEHPLYVVALDAKANTVTVGPREHLYKAGFIVKNTTWMAEEALTGERRLFTKIRYGHPGAIAMVKPLADGSVAVEFETPQLSITPGQVAVFYDDETLFGGGYIEG